MIVNILIINFLFTVYRNNFLHYIEFVFNILNVK